MEQEFVSYEQAVALKELGFDEDCFFIKTKDTGELLYNHSDYYDFPEEREAEIPTPLKQQVFRWFREKYGWYIELGYGLRIDFYYTIYKDSVSIAERNDYSTYEEAENACIDKLISIAKQKDNDKIQNSRS